MCNTYHTLNRNLFLFNPLPINSFEIKFKNFSLCTKCNPYYMQLMTYDKDYQKLICIVQIISIIMNNMELQSISQRLSSKVNLNTKLHSSTSLEYLFQGIGSECQCTIKTSVCCINTLQQINSYIYLCQCGMNDISLMSF